MNAGVHKGGAAMPRMQFGNYQIIRKIGTGGMAQVFLAERLGLEGFHRRVALKCILPQMTRDERFVQMFINEARLGSQLHHPNIIEIQDFNKVNDVYYIAMEFVEGVDLGELVSWYRSQGKSFPAGMAIDVMLQSLEGLGYAHEASTESGEHMNIIHRDIKPSNLLLTRRGTVKIADFGIAKAATNAYQTKTAEVTKGSLAYMSPEQITREAEPRPCSDLFALGAVFFEMLSLRPLFDGDNVPSIMFKVAQVEIDRDMDEVASRFPDLEPVLRHTLAREQSDRYQTAQEMAEALRALRGNYPKTPTIREAVALYFEDHPPQPDPDVDDEGLEAATSLFSDIIHPRGAVQLGASSEVGGAHLSQLHPHQTAHSAVHQNLAPSSTGVVLPADATLEHRAQPTSRRLLVAGVVVLLLALLAGGGWWALKPPPTTYLNLTSRPSGATVLINGEVKSSVTPALLELPQGTSAEIRLELTGYKPFVETVTYQQGERISRSPELEPEVRYTSLEITSDPVGAAVLVDGKAVGAVTPFKIERIEAGRALTVSLSLEGYEPWSQAATLEADRPLMLSASLTPVAKVEAPPATRPTNPGTTTAPAPRGGSNPPPAAVTGTGELVVNSIPNEYAVYVDGQRKGLTPMSLKLSAGGHSVSLVNQGDGTRKDFSVDVPNGGRVTRVWDFYSNEWFSD